MKKGQEYFNFATDLEKLLTAGPGHLHLMQQGYGGFSWWHNLAALMLVACLSSLEETLGQRAWQTYKYNEDEFEALACIRNAYVHTGSNVTKIRDKNSVSTVNKFHADLTAGKVVGIKGTPITPYFDVNGSVIELKESAIRRMRSLYFGLLEKAGLLVW